MVYLCDQILIMKIKKFNQFRACDTDTLVAENNVQLLKSRGQFHKRKMPSFKMPNYGVYLTKMAFNFYEVL